MSDSYVKGMRRRLHIRILLSRAGCATYPHQDQISGGSFIALLAPHAGKGGAGQFLFLRRCVFCLLLGCWS
jgi:hypothetical protein